MSPNLPRGHSLHESRGGPDTGEQIMFCELDRGPAQVRVARENARKALFDWGLGDHADFVELVVSELATNAICHGGGTAWVGVLHADGILRVEVHDDGAGRPLRRKPGADDEAGRGLALVDGLIELQGGERGITEDAAGRGKTVYAVIRLAAEAAGSR